MALFDSPRVAGRQSVEDVDPEVDPAHPPHLDPVVTELVLGGHTGHVIGHHGDVMAGPDQGAGLLSDASIELEGVLDEHADAHRLMMAWRHAGPIGGSGNG